MNLFTNFKKRTFQITILVVIVFLLHTFISLYTHLFDRFGLIQKQNFLDVKIINFLLTPVLIWFSCFLCYKYAPYAAGQRLQNAIEILKINPNDYSKSSKFLDLKLVLFKALSSLISTLGGGSLGKEGPSVHMSAAIFAFFGNKFRNIFEKTCILTWLITGSSIGLLFVFNCPVSALVFGSEKLLKISFHEFKKSIIFLTFSIILCSIFFIKSEPMFLIKNVNINYLNLDFWLITTIIVLLSLLALTSIKNFGAFIFLKIFSISNRKQNIVIALIATIIAVLNLAGGIYSFGGGIHGLEFIIKNNNLISLNELLIRIINTTLTFASGSPGGIIAPSLAIGASIGNLIQQIINDFNNFFIISAMLAALSIAIGEACAAAFLIYEITGQNLEILPLLLLISHAAHYINFLLKKKSRSLLTYIIT